MALPLVLGGSFGWLFIGIAALLLWLAVYYLIGKPLADLVRGVPVVGRDLANAILGGINTVRDWALGWAASAAYVVVEVVSVPVRAVYDFVTWVTLNIEDAIHHINEVAAVAAGAIGNLGRDVATALLRGAAAQAAAAGATALASQTLALANRLQSTTIPQAKAEAISQSATYTNTRVAAEAGARARAIDDVRVEVGRAIDGEASARSQADAALAGAAAATAAELARRIAAEGAGARAYTDTRVRPIDQELTQLRDVTLPAALASALAATAAVATQLAQVRTQCVDPLCGAFGPQVDLWRALATGAELALVAGLVARAVSDPEGAARETAGMVGGAVGLAGGIAGAFGVRV